MKRQSTSKADNIFIRTMVYRLYPSKRDQERFSKYCDYRRYVWNKFKSLNDHAYQNYRYEKEYYSKVGIKVKNKDFCAKYPTLYSLKADFNYDKKQWEYKLPSKIALMAITDYDNALSNFKNKAMPDWGRSKFKSKKAPRQGFKLPAESLSLSGKTITLAKGRKDKKHPRLVLKSRQNFLDYAFGTVSFYREKGRYYAAVPYYVPKENVASANALRGKVGIDLNVKHYNFFDGKSYSIDLNIKRLNYHYERINHYQRLLAKKKVVSRTNVNSNNYSAVRTKLQREYTRVNNLQNDFLQKLTTKLCQKYKQIIIEDLDVKHMKMGVASKGLHRAMFGEFRQILAYKAEQYGNDLIIADRLYPSTQICSNCGYRKTGDEKITLRGNQKHQTKHNEYICYECGKKLDRDDNASINLYQYLESNWLKEKETEKTA